MVEQIEPDIILGLGLLPALDLVPVGKKVAARLDEIEITAANPFDGLGIGCQATARRIDGARAAHDRVIERLRRVGDVKAHAAGRWAVLGTEIGSLAFGLGIQEQRDTPLLVTGDGFLGMTMGGDEAHRVELSG